MRMRTEKDTSKESAVIQYVKERIGGDNWQKYIRQMRYSDFLLMRYRDIKPKAYENNSDDSILLFIKQIDFSDPNKLCIWKLPDLLIKIFGAIGTTITIRYMNPKTEWKNIALPCIKIHSSEFSIDDALFILNRSVIFESDACFFGASEEGCNLLRGYNSNFPLRGMIIKKSEPQTPRVVNMPPLIIHTYQPPIIFTLFQPQAATTYRRDDIGIIGDGRFIKK